MCTYRRILVLALCATVVFAVRTQATAAEPDAEGLTRASDLLRRFAPALASKADTAEADLVPVEAEADAGPSGFMESFPYDRPALFYGPDPSIASVPARRRGRGLLVSDSVYVVTTNRLIAGADRIRVILPGGRSMPAYVLLADPDQDLAVIRVGAGSVSVVGAAEQGGRPVRR